MQEWGWAEQKWQQLYAVADNIGIYTVSYMWASFESKTYFSVQVQWIVSEDRGPNGASGKGKFKPAFSVGLLVTLYKV